MNIEREIRPVITFKNKLARLAWGITWVLLYRPSPRPFHKWRCFLLQLFGARLGVHVHPYPSSRVWAPWNLVMGDYACLGESVDCYNVATVTIGNHSTVSQYSFLCTASHDYTQRDMPLIAAPIVIGEMAWVTADVYIGPGVMIGEGSVVAARSSVLKDVPDWVVVGGAPARVIKKRELR